MAAGEADLMFTVLDYTTRFQDSASLFPKCNEIIGNQRLPGRWESSIETSQTCYEEILAQS